MQLVTLVNRTTKTLQGVWDGRHFDLAPGKHQFTEIQARNFQEQNPIMGSEDPTTLQKQFLLGIEENGDDCSPIEQSDSIELWDRRLDPRARQDVQVVSATGLYRPRDVRQPISGTAIFDKP